MPPHLCGVRSQREDRTLRSRFKVWLDVQCTLYADEVKNDKDMDEAVEDVRAQGERILDQVEKIIREETIGEPLYLQVTDVTYEGERDE